MNAHILAIALLLLGSTGLSFAESFRLVTYNIRQGKGQEEILTPEVSVNLPFGIHLHVDAKPLPIARGRKQLDRIADVMKSLSPDVLCLQEVNGRSVQSLGRDQAGYLAKKLGMHHVWALAQSDGGVLKKQGNAVLSKYEIAESRVVELNAAQGDSERRIAVFARVMLPGHANGVWICSTHTSSDSAALREGSVAHFAESLKSLKEPVVLAGDFNAGPETKAITDLMAAAQELGRPLTDAFAAVGTGPGKTSSAPEGKVRIDYVLSTPELAPVSASSPRDINESDHFCVVAELKSAEAAPVAAAAVTTAPEGMPAQVLGVSMLTASSH